MKTIEQQIEDAAKKFTLQTIKNQHDSFICGAHVGRELGKKEEYEALEEKLAVALNNVGIDNSGCYDVDDLFSKIAAHIEYQKELQEIKSKREGFELAIEFVKTRDLTLGIALEKLAVGLGILPLNDAKTGGGE